jgi:exodeoxyribonuclease-3
MKIATWNVNGLRARLEFVLHWLRAREPDVVGLQELKLAAEAFPVDELRAAGYHAAFHAQKSWNGVAILSREPLTVVRRGLTGQEALGARLITASVGDLSFTTVYCPNGKSTSHEDYPRKLAWFESLRRLLNEQHDPGRPTVLCGDFNVVPAPIDSWNEEALAGRIFHTEAERARFRSLLEWGATDLFRHHLPDTQGFSWWDYRAGSFHRNHGLRIDLLLGTPSVAARLRHVEVDRDYRKKKDGLTASDHAPVIADLDEY